MTGSESVKANPRPVGAAGIGPMSLTGTVIDAIETAFCMGPRHLPLPDRYPVQKLPILYPHP
ncbi:hypothetical protein [Rhodobacter calidifons]|uniref:Uncharacterized protein n=1 Tax=Rhodobacter calidifons TaxID=2715277 RepID=A0ABX0G352_9RHOB|nr:hypothetical protein [Rhodobacter calidifons]NHB75624.1 hypothetical protein [Rhodobacter calidifons]